MGVVQNVLNKAKKLGSGYVMGDDGGVAIAEAPVEAGTPVQATPLFNDNAPAAGDDDAPKRDWGNEQELRNLARWGCANVVKLSGEVMDDPRETETPNEQTYTEFRLKQARVNRDEQVRVQFLVVQCYGKCGEFALDELKAGDRIALKGHLQIGGNAPRVVADRINTDGNVESLL